MRWRRVGERGRTDSSVASDRIVRTVVVVVVVDAAALSLCFGNCCNLGFDIIWRDDDVDTILDCCWLPILFKLLLLRRQGLFKSSCDRRFINDAVLLFLLDDIIIRLLCAAIIGDALCKEKQLVLPIIMVAMILFYSALRYRSFVIGAEKILVHTFEPRHKECFMIQ